MVGVLFCCFFFLNGYRFPVPGMGVFVLGHGVVNLQGCGGRASELIVNELDLRCLILRTGCGLKLVGICYLNGVLYTLK